MTAEQIRDRLDAVPFLPFVLCLADSRQVVVPHPDLLSFAGRNRVVSYWDRDSRVEIIDIVLIVSLRFSQDDFTHEPRHEPKKREDQF